MEICGIMSCEVAEKHPEAHFQIMNIFCAKNIVTMFKVLTIGQNNDLHMINDFMPVHSLAMKEGTAFLLPHCGLSACNAFLSGG